MNGVGWLTIYTKIEITAQKRYWNPDNFRFQNIPLREWSQYKSDKYNGQVDGTYKIDDRQMLDFSDELFSRTVEYRWIFNG